MLIAECKRVKTTRFVHHATPAKSHTYNCGVKYGYFQFDLEWISSNFTTNFTQKEWHRLTFTRREWNFHSFILRECFHESCEYNACATHISVRVKPTLICKMLSLIIDQNLQCIARCCTYIIVSHINKIY